MDSISLQLKSLCGREATISISPYASAANLAERAGALLQFQAAVRHLIFKGQIIDRHTGTSIRRMGAAEGSVVHVVQSIARPPIGPAPGTARRRQRVTLVNGVVQRHRYEAREREASGGEGEERATAGSHAAASSRAEGTPAREATEDVPVASQGEHGQGETQQTEEYEDRMEEEGQEATAEVAGGEAAEVEMREEASEAQAAGGAHEGSTSTGASSGINVGEADGNVVERDRRAWNQRGDRASIQGRRAAKRKRAQAAREQAAA